MLKTCALLMTLTKGFSLPNNLSFMTGWPDILSRGFSVLTFRVLTYIWAWSSSREKKKNSSLRILQHTDTSSAVTYICFTDAAVSFHWLGVKGNWFPSPDFSCVVFKPWCVKRDAASVWRGPWTRVRSPLCSLEKPNSSFNKTMITTNHASVYGGRNCAENRWTTSYALLYWR